MSKKLVILCAIILAGCDADEARGLIDVDVEDLDAEFSNEREKNGNASDPPAPSCLDGDETAVASVECGESLTPDEPADGAHEIVSGSPESSVTPMALAAPHCGLNIWLSGNTAIYTIRNCHSHAVKRELNIGQGPDTCTCHHIPAHSQVMSSCNLAPWETVNGIKSC
jgi:hypothetical protein